MRKESLLDNPRAAVDKQVSPPRGAKLHNVTYEDGKFIVKDKSGGVLYKAEPQSESDIETVLRVGPDHERAHNGHCNPDMISITNHALPNYVQSQEEDHI